MENFEACEQQLRRLARKNLGNKRFHHVKNVVDMARTLARRYGANEEKAVLAAWLHDLCKEKNHTEMLEILSLDKTAQAALENRPFPVWHGPVAVVYARQGLGIKDEDILQAVASHTTGRANMGKLEKVVYMADMISAERHYEGVEHIRRLAEKNLDEAVYASLLENAAHVRLRKKEMDRETLAAIAWYEENKPQTVAEVRRTQPENGG